MTKDELLSRLQDIEWEDFEVKSASRELPKNIWESVSAFSNGSGGWIVFGVVQNGKKFEVEGVNNGEKIESDFLNTLRSGNKMNHPILPISKKYSIEGKTVLAFYIPSSPFKPVWYTGITNTFIRSGSGDRRATEMEVYAMLRDQAFGVLGQMNQLPVRLSKILIRVLSIRSDAISNFSMKVILMQMPMTILFVAKQEFMPEEDRN